MTRTGAELWMLIERGAVRFESLSSRERARVVQYLHERGYGVDEIVSALGVSEDAVLMYLATPSVDWQRSLAWERERDLRRLDALYRAWESRAFEDLRAAEFVRRVLEARAQLLGTDALPLSEDPSVRAWKDAASAFQVLEGGGGDDTASSVEQVG